MKNKYYIRSSKLTLKFNTKSKLNKIKRLINLYKHIVNLYIKKLHNSNNLELNKQNLNSINTNILSERYKSNALKQALEIIKSCKDENKKIPKFNGYPNLDAKFVNIEQSNIKSFDTIIKLSTETKGKRLSLVTKKHKKFNYWNNKGKLIQGCELRENYIIVWFKVEKQKYKEGNSLGIDLGMNKIIVSYDGKSNYEKIGLEFKKLNDKILRKRKNSKAYKKVLLERNNYFDYCVNKINYNDLGLLVIENLKNIKLGKKGRKSRKYFRKRLQHWNIRRVIARINERCEENRVCLWHVNPRNTSRMCPICGNVDVKNRTDQYFSCLACSHEQDADEVGARNILSRGLDSIRSLESRMREKGEVWDIFPYLT